MATKQRQWILAYDATCGTCRKISRIVGEACDRKLQILPLGRPDIRQLRTRALGEEAPWTPTLLRVDNENVRAWTGIAMAYPLVRHLGPRSTLKVVSALGRVRSARPQLPGDPKSASGRIADIAVISVSVGVVAAARLLLTGKPPVPAANENVLAVRWVEKHRESLPSTYDEVVAYPISYQRAIFAVSPPEVQSRFWVEALKRDRAKKSDLTKEQAEIFNRAIELASMGQVFTLLSDPDLDKRLAGLEDDAKRLFEIPKSYHLFVALAGNRIKPEAS